MNWFFEIQNSKLNYVNNLIKKYEKSLTVQMYPGYTDIITSACPSVPDKSKLLK